jgi:L-aminopeptidase/D-esterase-like protein
MNRRTFERTLLAAAAGGLLAPSASAGEPGGLTDVAGLTVGHFTDSRRPTGCTVVLCGKGAVCGVDVRGSAPGTRETDLLNPINTVQKVHGIVLAGGSAYGLDAASGVMRYLEERGIGFPVGSAVVPIVPAAILFDLGVGDSKIRPNAESGYRACEAARVGKIAEGNVGAGGGATVGKMFGSDYAMKSGLGTASLRVGNTGIVVAALVAVNAVGDVRDPFKNQILAGALNADKKTFRDTAAQIRGGYGLVTDRLSQGNTNTTIGIVATNARLTKDEATKVAQMAHDGLARTINPVHSPMDGDTIFAVGTGESGAKVNAGMVGALAAEIMASAVVRAVLQATGIPGYLSHRDLVG